MTQLSSQADVTREALHKALSPTGENSEQRTENKEQRTENPPLLAFFGVMKALGIKIRPVAADA